MTLVLSFMDCNTRDNIRPQLLKSSTSAIIVIIIIMVVLRRKRNGRSEKENKVSSFVMAGLTVFLYLRTVKYKRHVAGY